MDGILLIYKNMYHYLNRFFLIQCGLFFLILSTTKNINEENNHFVTSSLILTTEFNSPAFAALEDINQTYTKYYLEDRTEEFEVKPLVWGEDNNLWVLQNFEFIDYKNEIQALSSMSITQETIPEIKNTKPETIAINEIDPEMLEIRSNNIHPSRVAMANNLMLSKYEYSPVNDSYLAESMQASEIDQIIEEEKNNVYQGPQKVFISGNESKVINSSNALLASLSKKKAVKKPKKQNSYEKHFKSYMLKGSIKVNAGLILPSSHKNIRIYRVNNNEVLEDAFVDQNKKYYEIHVTELTGYLIAELINSDGDIYGYTEVDLLAMDMRKVDRRDILIPYDLNIDLASDELLIKAISGESTTKNEVSLKPLVKKGSLKIPNLEVQVEVDGLDDQLQLDKKYELKSDMFTRNSNFLLKMQAKNYWGSLAIGLGKSRNKIRMYRNSLVDALLDNYKDSSDGYGVIWGRVVDENGKPIAGAQVEIAGDLATGPFYFNNAHLVDYKLVKTNYDGLFAFVKVLPGLQAARAVVNGEMLPVELTVVDSEAVSYVEIRQSKKRHITVDAYSPITNKKVNTSYKLIGSEKIHDTYINEKNIELWPGNKGLTILESDPGKGYELTRHMINRKKLSHRLPVISSHWLAKVFKQKNVYHNRSLGVVIGYVDGDSFEVFANADLDGWSKSKIIYFDKKGRVLPKGLGQVGGGFIMYDVPMSVSTVSILAKNTDKIYTSIIIPDRDFISVINTDFKEN